MHITLVISSLSHGGAERVLSTLGNYWVTQGHKVSLITFCSPKCKPFYPIDSKINLIQLDQSGKPYSNSIILMKRVITLFFMLRRSLKNLDPDIIISFMDLTNIFTLIATMGLKIPNIISERTDPNYLFSNSWIKRPYRKIRDAIYSRAKCLVVQTKSVADSFKNLTNICVIPNVVSAPVHTKEVSLSSANVSNIVSIGRLSADKGFAALIQAFAQLLEFHPNLTLTIYGEGKERHNLSSLITSLGLAGKVHLPGATKNIPDVLMKADLFIFPSLREGFSNALCEAMSIGLPVIASNCAGNMAIVRDKVDGRLFPVNDIEKLTNIALEIIQDAPQRVRLGEHAKEVCIRFNKNAIFEQWDQVIIDATGVAGNARGALSKL